MPIEAIEPRRLYRQIADHLRQLIDKGEFPVGSRLPTERELSELLNVSRPTVREALIALEVEGKVRIRVGSGIYVAEPPTIPPLPPLPHLEGPFELLRAREFIEGAIAAEAARAVSPADIAAMDDILRRMENDRQSNQEMIVLDRAFHTVVTGTLGNAVLVRFVGELFDQRINPYFQQLSRYFESPDSWRAAFLEHRAIRDAIVSGDPQAADNAMRRHLQQSQLRFSQSFGDDGTSSAEGEPEGHPENAFSAGH